MNSQSGQLNRRSKLQISKLAVYWAVLTFALALFWTTILNTLRLSGPIAGLSLGVPVALGGLLAFVLYRLRDHQVLEYDENGYSVIRGKTGLEGHGWSEFKECSIIRDSVGKTRVRAYTERDGDHVDIDSSASGVDPYSFRDFMEARMKKSIVRDYSNLEGYLFDGLEREIQRGRTNWVADLNETSRMYDISGESFPLVAKGNTRPRGFLLSRFVAFTVMPDYQVCLYASSMKGSGGEAKSNLMRLLRIIETQRDQKEIKWSWLLLFSEHEAPDSLAKTIETFGNKDVGIGCIEIDTGRMITSPNQLGKSLSNQMRFNKLIRDLNKKKQAAS